MKTKYLLSKTRRIGTALFVGGLLTGSLLLRVSAQDNQPAEPAREAPAIAAEENERQDSRHSPVVRDILRMTGAGVSSGVILTFIQHSSPAYQPTSSDIIALKERGVADDVVTALLNRSAEIKDQKDRVKGAVAVPTIVKRLSTGGRVDPESYEFWWYHYGYPRALASSYRTLSPYDPAYRFGVSRRSSSPSGFSTTRYRSR